MIKDDTFEPLIPAVKQLTGLVSVATGGSYITKDSHGRMLSALASCKSLYKLRILAHGDAMPELLQQVKPRLHKFKKLAWLEFDTTPHACSEHVELLWRTQAVWQAVATSSKVSLLARRDGYGAALHCSRREPAAGVLRSIARGTIDGPDHDCVGIKKANFFDLGNARATLK